jgi:hypothetical protein
MGVEMLEKNKFYSFGREVNLYNPNKEFRNFLPTIAGQAALVGVIKLGRKKKADKTRQAIADKYQSLRIDCEGIDSSISKVSNDLSSLKSSKPKKNKDERVWKVQVEETENTLREITSAKRNLICGKDIATPPATPSPSSGGGSPMKDDYNVSPNKGGAIDNKAIMPDSESPDIPSKSNGGTTKKNMLLYVLLGLAVVGGVIYFIRRKK